MPQMDLLIIVLIMVVLARLAGELLTRQKQSPTVGEVLVGVLLGPYILGLVNPQRDVALMSELKGIAELGVFFLIFHAGLELSLSEIGVSIKKALPVIFGGLAIPLLLGILVVGFLGFPLMNAFFISLCLSLTALPVSVRVLSDLGRIQTLEGQAILATAVGNDIIAMVMLAIILNTEESGGFGLEVIGISITKVMIFIIIVFIFHRIIGMKVTLNKKKIPAAKFYLDKMITALKSKESMFGVVMLIVLAFGGLAYIVGLHFLVGAFFGALLISIEFVGRTNFERVGRIVSAISMGFIAPLFFVYIGISFYVTNTSSLYLVPIFLLAFTIAKYVGGHLGARSMSFHPAKARAVGIGITNRGTMELIIANIGVEAGLLTNDQFSIILLVVMIMMIITPLLLKHAFEQVDRIPQPVEETVYAPLEVQTEEPVMGVQEYEPISKVVGEQGYVVEQKVSLLSYERYGEDGPLSDLPDQDGGGRSL